jgi:hypothetical protein
MAGAGGGLRPDLARLVGGTEHLDRVLHSLGEEKLPCICAASGKPEQAAERDRVALMETG